MYRGAFGSWFSWQNTLLSAAPLMLTALCTALPAQLGLVIIGGEGALVLGGLAAMAAGLPLADTARRRSSCRSRWRSPAWPPAARGSRWPARCGTGAASTRRSRSLLLSYIAIAVINQVVEGPMRDPASLNKPSTRPLRRADLIGNIPGMDVHWGLVDRRRRLRRSPGC